MTIRDLIGVSNPQDATVGDICLGIIFRSHFTYRQHLKGFLDSRNSKLSCIWEDDFSPGLQSEEFSETLMRRFMEFRDF